MNCEICKDWAGVADVYGFETRTGTPIVTNHHPNCPHYNDSLMDVWCAEVDGNKYYCCDEQSCRETVGEEGCEKAKVSKIKMHREVFENLPEFDGF